jgi:hypothetical protein
MVVVALLAIVCYAVALRRKRAQYLNRAAYYARYEQACIQQAAGLRYFEGQVAASERRAEERARTYLKRIKPYLSPAGFEREVRDQEQSLREYHDKRARRGKAAEERAQLAAEFGELRKKFERAARRPWLRPPR